MWLLRWLRRGLWFFRLAKYLSLDEDDAASLAWMLITLLALSRWSGL